MPGGTPDTSGLAASDPPQAVGGSGAAAAAGSAAPHELEPFDLERFFAKWEFNAEHLLCCSDRQETCTWTCLLQAAVAAVRAAGNGFGSPCPCTPLTLSCPLHHLLTTPFAAATPCAAAASRC